MIKLITVHVKIQKIVQFEYNLRIDQFAISVQIQYNFVVQKVYQIKLQ